MMRIKALDAEGEEKVASVRTVFQSSHHYNSVLQHINGSLSFYDEKTMSVVATSRSHCPPLAHLAFSQYYGEFYACPQQVKGKHSYLSHFWIKEGVLECSSFTVKTGGAHSMALLSTAKPALVLFEEHQFRVVSLHGTTLASGQIFLQGRPLTIFKAYHLGQDRFLLVVEYSLVLARFSSGEQVDCWGQTIFDGGIVSTFLDNTLRQYVGVCTSDRLLHVVSIGVKLATCYTVECAATQLCFFYAGENTSPTNKLKDRVYVLWQANSQGHNILVEGDSMNIRSSGNTYIMELRQSCLPNGQTYNLKPIAQYSLATGAARQLLFNRHDFSQVRVLTRSGSLLCYNISSLYDGADQEWIILSFRFERCFGNRSVEFQPQEDEFEKDQIKRYTQPLSQEDLDDWSFCLFEREELSLVKLRRRHIYD